ncbi:sodium:proton antiporter [Microbacterium sp. ZXX196]|nr:sodium:proton antiporter [Microbacterium sp. ZXX196]
MRGMTTHDAAPGRRDETPDERADRNWLEVLQELRVLQTGTQILTGFLLAIVFQSRFDDLSGGQRAFYLGLVVLSALSAVVALAPVALHRGLFARGRKGRTVRFGHVALIVALATVSILLVGVVAFIFDIVVGRGAAIGAAASLGAVVAVLWIAAPLALRAGGGRGEAS